MKQREHIAEAAKQLGFKSFIDPLEFVAFIESNKANIQNWADCQRSLAWLEKDCGGFHGGIYAKFGNRDVWASEATVDIQHYPMKSSEDCHAISVQVEISWSSSGRNVAQAYNAIENYQNALSFAAKVEAFVAGRPIVLAKEPVAAGVTA